MNSEKPGALYLRLSKEMQAQKGDALERQRFVLRRAIASNGWQVPIEYEFCDLLSGRTSDRPEYQKLVALIKGRKIGLLAVERIDRISRDIQEIATFQKLLERNGVLFYEHYLGRVFDFSNPEDWKYFLQSGLTAEEESRKMSRRIKGNKEYYRSLGKFQGGRVPFGLKKSESGAFEVDFEKLEEAKQRIIWFLKTKSPVETTRLIYQNHGKRISYQSLLRWLNSPAIRGHMPYLFGDVQTRDRVKENERDVFKLNRTPSQILYNQHQSIFDFLEPGVEKEVDLLLRLGQRRQKKNTYVHALTGLVKCDRCGEFCHLLTSVKRSGLRQRSFQCRKYREHRACQPEPGGKITTNYNYIEELLIEALCDRAIEVIEAGLEDLENQQESPEVQKLRAEIARVEKLVEVDEDFRATLEKKQAALRKILDAPTDNQLRHRKEDLVQMGSNILFWQLMPEEDKQALFHQFVESIRVDGDRVIIKLTV